MPYCEQCGKFNWDDQSVCASCGAPLNPLAARKHEAEPLPLNEETAVQQPGIKEFILGILSIWPVLYFFLFMILAFTMLSAILDDEEELSGSAKALGTVLIYLFYPTVILMLSLIFNFIFYYVFRSHRVPRENRILWSVLLVSINIFALPIFWYSYIWENKNAEGG
ncbi:MAG: hypothetical protein R6U37_07235 [Dehalococcoidia bacterium]